MNIVFFGSSKYVIPVISALNINHNLSLVITTEKQSIDAIPNYCISQKIPYKSISSFDENLKSLILKHKSSIGVVADFGLIIPSDILNLFPKGLLNVHPSLLPHYRGATPVQETILNGDQETGVTVIKLDEELDHGPILAQEKEVVMSHDTSETLYTRLFEKGAKLLSKSINNYLKGDIKLLTQNHEKATFTKRLTRQNGYIDLENLPPSEIIERMIRAYHPWPGVWTEFKINALKLRIKFLPEKKVQVEGKKPMGYKDFINGYPQGKEILQKLQLIPALL